MADLFVSVVMPNYNGGKCIRRAIESFIAHAYDAKELLIVDGKSTDDSHAIIQEYCKSHPEITWLNVADRGISDAVNIAIAVAKGDIIGYLGSDDILCEGVFHTIARWERFIDFDAIFFNSYTYYVKERRCILQRPPVTEITFEELLARGTLVGLQNTFYRRRIFDDVLFNVENRYSMDYELLLEVAQRQAMFFYVDEVATLNYFDGNISHNNDAQALEAAYVARRFCGDYQGQLFGEDLLPEEDRRPKPVEQDSESLDEGDGANVDAPGAIAGKQEVAASFGEEQCAEGVDARSLRSAIGRRLRSFRGILSRALGR